MAAPWFAISLKSKFPQALSILKKRCIHSTSTCSFWNKDWKPGPFPETEAERIASAKKYGLQPEDYKPFPKEWGFGDYPNITVVSVDSRDPNEPWDYRRHKRDFGEPIAWDMDAYDQYRYDTYKFDNPENPNRYPLRWWQVITYYVCILGGLGIVYRFVGHETNRQLAVMPKQYPYNELWKERGWDMREMPDVKHYGFPPPSSSSSSSSDH